MVANWRTKTTRLLEGTPMPGSGILNFFLASFALTLEGTTCWERSFSMAASSFAALISPFMN